jgi:hypothetical protein
MLNKQLVKKRKLPSNNKIPIVKRLGRLVETLEPNYPDYIGELLIFIFTVTKLRNYHII